MVILMIMTMIMIMMDTMMTTMIMIKETQVEPAPVCLGTVGLLTKSKHEANSEPAVEASRMRIAATMANNHHSPLSTEKLLLLLLSLLLQTSSGMVWPTSGLRQRGHPAVSFFDVL